MAPLLLEIRWNLIFDYRLAIESIPFVLEGLGYTLLISLISFVLALMGGLLIALMRLSKVNIARGFARFYVSFFRGVPIIVTLFFIYFGLPVLGILIPAVESALIGFGLTGSAYTSEIIRASILGVDKGQWEASQSLGLNYRQTLIKIILPQATRMSVPPLSNVMIDMVKTSSVTAMITVPEIFQKAKIVGGAEQDYMTMYLLVAVIYWLICLGYGWLQGRIEKHLSQYVETI